VEDEETTAQVDPWNLAETWDQLLEKLVGWFDGFILMLPNLLVALLAVILSALIGRVLARGLERVLSRTDLPTTARQLFARITRFSALLIGVLLALSALDLDGAVTSLLAGAGVVGLALGFAFQDLASNFISGVGLSLRRPLQVGDILEHGDTMGVVEDVDLRTTSVRTFQGQLVLIPNKHIYQEKVTIYTDQARRRVDLAVGVSYGDDLALVEKVTREAIEGIESRLEDDPPKVFFTGFGGSSIDLVAAFWIAYESQAQFMKARSEAIMAIHQAYDAADITIPFPIRTLDFGIKGGETLSTMLAERDAA